MPRENDLFEALQVGTSVYTFSEYGALRPGEVTKRTATQVTITDDRGEKSRWIQSYGGVILYGTAGERYPMHRERVVLGDSPELAAERKRRRALRMERQLTDAQKAVERNRNLETVKALVRAAEAWMEYQRETPER